MLGTLPIGEERMTDIIKEQLEKFLPTTKTGECYVLHVE